MNLPINEIFETVQGEAHWTGTPSVFVRLQWCDVGCPWCDTKHTWELNPDKEISFDNMMAKTADSPSYAFAEIDQLIEHLLTYESRHVVFTGGEPAAYDLYTLTQTLHKEGRSTQIETSGTETISVCDDTWVTLSPKIDMPGNKKVLLAPLYLADEIKMPVGKPKDIEKLQELLQCLSRISEDFPMVWLQPLSTSEKATKLCVKMARKYGWRISLQTHKFAGWR